MKNKLQSLPSTLLWVMLLAAYAVPANAQIANQMTTARKGNAMAAGTTTPVTGSGTTGQIARWEGSTSTSFALANSVITEDKSGKIGIGTTTPTSLLTVRGLIETTLGGYKFPDGTIQTTAFDPNQVVRSLNGLRGDVTLAAGVNITVTPSGGNTLTIAAPNVLTSVVHNATLTGNGTAASPLGIANGGVGTNQLADNAVTAAKIAPATVVRSLNGLKDNVTLAAGSNITLTSVGNTLTIASTAADPEQNAFQRSIDLSVTADFKGGVGSIPVPSGKRLVIEYISIKVFGNNADFQPMTISTTVAGFTSTHFIQLPLDVSDFGNAFDKPVRIFADTDLVFNVIERNGAGASVIVTVSGHFVDLP
jgi:hypothetical protein